MNVQWGNKEYKVFSKPTKHIRIDALKVKPNISARWNKKSDNPPKACTCDMIHLSPYKGCTIDCNFCSLPRYRGYNLLKYKQGISVVFENYPEYVNNEIEKCDFLHTFDLGADADCFMSLNKRYHITEKTMAVLNKWGLPFSVSTKGVITDRAIDELAKNPNSWAQISLITIDEAKRKAIIPGDDGATIEQIKDNIQSLKSKGVHVTARLQPFMPYISENPKKLIPWIKEVGFDSVVFGLLRMPMGAGKSIFQKYNKLSEKDYAEVYRNKTPGYWQISDSLLHRILKQTRRLCDEYELDFGLCDMYDKKDGQYRSLQSIYGNCTACETVNCYGYRREKDHFIQVPDCIGNCMYCSSSPCGHNQFYTSVTYNIKDYQRLKNE